MIKLLQKGGLQDTLGWFLDYGRVVFSPSRIFKEAFAVLRHKAVVAILPLFVLAGCGGGYSVRHLSSDVALIVPGQTSGQEVLAILGSPDHKAAGPGQGETWHYVSSQKSLLRKTPYIGNRMGSEDYEVVTVVIEGAQVKNASFRLYDEQAFAATGIPKVDPVGN